MPVEGFGVFLAVDVGGGLGGEGVVVFVSAFVVVSDDFAVGVAGKVDWWVGFPEEGSQGNVPEFQSGVSHDQPTVEVGDEEDVGDGEAAEEDAEDDADSFACAEFF